MPEHSIHRGGGWGNIYWLCCDDAKFAEKMFNIDELQTDYNIQTWAKEEMDKHVKEKHPEESNDTGSTDTASDLGGEQRESDIRAHVQKATDESKPDS